MSQEEEIVMRDVTNAGLCIGDRIGREAASQLDLEEALEASRYASHPYSTHPREWPPLIEVGDTWELPSVLIERYNTAGGEGTALCGIFPEIRRAWASVDNSLFLWRFDKRDGQCPEYSGEDQAICAVGLAKCRPGVFVEAIQYLLVLATPVELVLVGVCCTEGPDGRDPYAEISVQPLPDYTISSDGVAMTCVTCTSKGRIFMAGRDGHIYELLYTTGSGWNKRCRKVCLTAGVGSMISRWVVPNVFKFGAVDPVVEMVVDNERQILYARTEEMKLQAYVFGPNGEGTLKMVAEERNMLNQKDVSQGNRQSTAAGRSNKPTIVSISPLSMLESKWLHLVASLSDGRRMYLSTSSSGSSFSGFSNHRQSPNCLKVISTRPSPPLGAGVGLGFGAASLAGRTQTEDLSMKVETAYYSVGTLVLSDSSPPAMSSLLVVSRDPSVHSQVGGTSGSSSRSSRALREVVSSLPIEGRMLFVADVLPSSDTVATVQSLYSELEYCGVEVSGESYEKACGKLWARGDLSTQHILPRRKIVVFTTMGMMELIFNRPVDILRRLLESNSPRSLLEDFFTRFGAGEAAAMCLMLAARIINFEDLISNIVADRAAEAFEDPRLVGMPQFDGSSGLSNTRTATGGFSMGQVVQEAEPIFSGAHDGLCLCTSRLLFPIWELSVMSKKPSSDAMSADGLVICRLSTSAMHVLESKIRSLERFLRSRRNQRRGLYGYVAGLGGVTGSILYGTGSELGATERNMVRNLFGAYSNGGESANKRQRLPYSPAELAATEVRAMECIRQLLLRSAEALFLLQLLSQHHVARLVQGLDANLKQALVQLTFQQLVCSEEGDQIATRLISAVMGYYTGLDGRGTVDDISGRLREGCPSYFKESDYKFFLAVERLERAALASDAEEKQSHKSGTEEMATAPKATTPGPCDFPSTIVRATIVQASTVYNDTPKTIEKAGEFIAQAAADGAQLVVFPEAYIGGYPRGYRFGIGVGVHNEAGRDCFRKYHASAIVVPGPEVDKLAEMARKNKVYLVMGAMEKDGYTLYCTALFFSSEGRFLGKHRKVMPTSLERCIWGYGDGSTIPVYDTPLGKLGAAICWENRMPLYRTSLYGQGIELYCAPTADGSKEWQSSMMHIAIEGGCFVMSACQFCVRKDFPDHADYLFTDWYPEQHEEAIVSQGGSVIISPLGKILAGPNFESEGLITADLDLGDIARAKLYFDVVGHYSRPDIFNLRVNDNQNKPVTFVSKSVKAEDDSEPQNK